MTDYKSPYKEVGLTSKGIFYSKRKKETDVLKGTTTARLIRVGSRGGWAEQHKLRMELFLSNLKKRNPDEYNRIKNGYNYKDYA